MYVEIDEKIIELVEEVTMTNFEAEGNKVPSENIESMLEELLLVIEQLKECIKVISKEKEKKDVE